MRMLFEFIMMLTAYGLIKWLLYFKGIKEISFIEIGIIMFAIMIYRIIDKIVDYLISDRFEK